jgi:hypothetical protein
VVADVGDRSDGDDPAGHGRLPPAHTGDEAVPLGHPDERDPGRLGDVRVVGVADDGRQDAVDVEQDGRPRRIRQEGRERIGERGGHGHAP